MLNDVKVIICGKEYKLKTAESPNYVFALARNLEAKINEIMEELCYKSNRTLKRGYIIPLIESGKLKMTIPDKPTSKNQKYNTVN
mgnify:CR=1 FL=1